jgi:hypothetical protein
MPTRSLRVQADFEWLVTAGVLTGVATVETSIQALQRELRQLTDGYARICRRLIWLRGVGHPALDDLARQAADEVSEPQAFADVPAAHRVYQHAYVSGVEWAIDVYTSASAAALTPAQALARLVFVPRKRGVGSYTLRRAD